MGKRKTQRKNATVLDGDDDSSSVSSSSTMRSDRMSVSASEEVEFNKDSLLDEAVDALYEKRTRKGYITKTSISIHTKNKWHSLIGSGQMPKRKTKHVRPVCLESVYSSNSKSIAHFYNQNIKARFGFFIFH